MKRLLIFISSFTILFADQEEIFTTPREKKPAGFKIDENLSPYAGGSILTGLHSVIEAGADSIYRFEGETSKSQWGRLGELLFVWGPLNQLAVVTQHEVFGHGYRLRDLGKNSAQVTQYSIDPPFPYGLGGGATGYRINLDNYGPSKDMAVAIAGMEGTSILANELKKQWFEEGKINPRQAQAYLSSQHDSMIYTLSASKDLRNAELGHDVEGYLAVLNKTYPGSKMTVSKLQLLSLINLIDPMTFLSYKAMGNYIVCGKDLDISKLKYLPNLRLGYAPYGPEVYLETHQRVKGKTIYSYIRGGRFSMNNYFGSGFEQRKLLQFGSHSFGWRTDLWKQPKLLLSSNPMLIMNMQNPHVMDLGYSHDKLTAKRYGGAAAITYRYQKDEESAFSAELQAGYKTPGYLPGESLNAGPMVRGSLNFKF